MLRVASSWQRWWCQCSRLLCSSTLCASGIAPQQQSRRLLQSIANTVLDRSRLAPSARCSWSNSVAPSAMMALGPGSTARRYSHYGLIFTCNVCEKRAGKAVSKIAYDKGVVIIQCEGCGNRHLIADRLGWFGEPGSVEDFVQSKDPSISKFWRAGSFEISPEDADGLKEIYDHLSIRPKR